jgi:hypothetical protein
MCDEHLRSSADKIAEQEHCVTDRRRALWRGSDPAAATSDDGERKTTAYTEPTAKKQADADTARAPTSGKTYTRATTQMEGFYQLWIEQAC